MYVRFPTALPNQSANPKIIARQRQAGPYQSGKETQYAGGQPSPTADRYTFNPRSGEITGATLYKDADASGKIRGWIFSVHVGSWGGLTTRLKETVAEPLNTVICL